MALVLILAAAFLTFVIIVFLGKDKNAGGLDSIVATQKNIAINFDIIDSPQVSNLKPFYVMETAFAYVVTDEFGQEIEGTISAGSKEDAKALLEESGYKVSSLREMGSGRSQPFTSY